MRMGIERVGQNSEEIPLGKTVTVLVPPHMIPTSRFPASLLTHHKRVLTQDEAAFVVLCYVVCHTRCARIRIRVRILGSPGLMTKLGGYGACLQPSSQELKTEHSPGQAGQLD